MNDIKAVLADAVAYAKTEGIAFIKAQAISTTVNKILDDYVVPPFWRSVKMNAIWNVVLVLIIAFNRFVFSPRLLMLYYVVSCASTFYGINKILSKIETINPVIAIGIPYTLGGIRGYLNKINVLMAIETVGIFFDWGLDWIVYVGIVGLTVHSLSIKYTVSVCQNLYSFMNINTSFRMCVYAYATENIAVIILYALLR